MLVLPNVWLLCLATVLGPGAGAPATAPASRPADPMAGFRPFLPKKLADRERILLDLKQRRVRLQGRVVLREGPPLELLACLQRTKEHESIIALEGKAQHMQLAMLAAGMERGRPVQWQPFKPPTGMTIQVDVWWREGKRWRHDDARNWIRRMDDRTQTLTRRWVFAGSDFGRNLATGRMDFLAEEGTIITVVNFGTAILDVPVRSSASEEELMFEANTPRIPPVGTQVYLVLQAVKTPATQTQPAVKPKPTG